MCNKSDTRQQAHTSKPEKNTAPTLAKVQRAVYGNITIDPKPIGTDVNGKALRYEDDILFDSEKLEQMYIMEMEYALKAMKKDYIIECKKAPDTN